MSCKRAGHSGRISAHPQPAELSFQPRITRIDTDRKRQNRRVIRHVTSETGNGVPNVFPPQPAYREVSARGGSAVVGALRLRGPRWFGRKEGEAPAEPGTPNLRSTGYSVTMESIDRMCKSGKPESDEFPFLASSLNYS